MRRLAILLALCLSGCASWQQSINGYESASLVSVKTADDSAKLRRRPSAQRLL